MLVKLHYFILYSDAFLSDLSPCTHANETVLFVFTLTVINSWVGSVRDLYQCVHVCLFVLALAYL